MNFLEFMEYNKHFKIKKNNNLPFELQMLEKEPNLTTEEICHCPNMEKNPLNNLYIHLYHGIRFQQYLEKLENIFKTKKILAGKYIDGYYSYSDNVNKGEYVSLLMWMGNDSIEYNTFIKSNITLVISPLCNATLTKYVNFNTWNMIQQNNLKLNNLYSYAEGECLCKDFIPIDFVEAIGVPYKYYENLGQVDYANKLIEDISTLMEQYEINLPIVDTSNNNKILKDMNKNKILSKVIH